MYDGGLVAQTTATQTTNGTVDTTRIKSLTVNVPTGLLYINITIGSLNSGNVILYVLSGTAYVYGTMNMPNGYYTMSLSQKPSSIGITSNIYISVRMYNGGTNSDITMYLKPTSTTVYFNSSYSNTETRITRPGYPWEFYGYKSLT